MDFVDDYSGNHVCLVDLVVSSDDKYKDDYVQ